MQKQLDVAIGSVENHRSRARSLATLVAAAAGALAAALVIAPTTALPYLARLTGLVAVCFLIFATGLFASSSVTFLSRGQERPNGKVAAGLFAWRKRIADDSPGDYETRTQQAQALRDRIRVQTHLGMLAATGAVVALLATLNLATFLPSPTVAVEIQLKTPLTLDACPIEIKQLVGDIKEEDLVSSSGFLRVALSRDLCGSLTDVVEISVTRSDIALISERPG